MYVYKNKGSKMKFRDEIYRHIQLLKGVTPKEVGTLTSSLRTPPRKKKWKGNRIFIFLCVLLYFFKEKVLK